MPHRHIRLAGLDDADALAALSTQLGYHCEEPEMYARLGIALASSDHAVYVCCEDRELAGWIHVMRTFHLESGYGAEIAGLIVSEGNRTHGIGTTLIHEAIRWAKAQGFIQLRVRTRIERVGARAFYEKLGFQPQKTQQVFELPL